MHEQSAARLQFEAVQESNQDPAKREELYQSVVEQFNPLDWQAILMRRRRTF
jgi:hypothetical protein